MLGLVKKDLVMIRGNLKMVFLLGCILLFVYKNENYAWAFLPAFFGMTLMISTFSYDEYNKSDAYISTFPSGRRNFVFAKYLTTFLVVLFSSCITLLLSVFLLFLQEHMDIESIFMTTLGSFTGVLFLQSLLYPLFYKFGIEKGRILLFLLTFGFLGLSYIFMELSITIPKYFYLFIENYFLYLLPIFLFFVLYISYKISIHIYLKKEF
ncbi:MAG: ABC-2 transporter permease [Bacilli bacterium]|nr:ABC-2 transporter permease [Bacilli bacterium]